jgi:NTP-dependent ternary system trypsin peptidase co-occuring protein
VWLLGVLLGLGRVLGERMTSPAVVRYALDDGTAVLFEVDPTGAFGPAGPEQIVGKVRDAVGPAVDAAKVVLDRAKQARPDEIELKFGIKVSGTLNWCVARATTEAAFEVTLKWSPGTGAEPDPGAPAQRTGPGTAAPA